MKRFHVHAHVEDLNASIAFYAKLFGAAHTRVESDYAKWHFHTLASIPTFNAGAGEVAATEAKACCAPDSPRGRAIAVAVKPASSCC